MRILMVSKACITGIYQRKLEEIARLGVELAVAVPPGWKDERGWMPLERVHTQGYTLQVTPMWFNGNFHLHIYPQFGSLLDEIRPDLVHIDEEPYNMATWHAMHLCQKAGIPALFFAWQNLLRRYPPPFSWSEQWVYRHSAYAIAGNHQAVQVLREKGYAGSAKVIPQFGVDPALYIPAEPPGSGPFTMAYIGRLVPEKGIDDLLHAAARLDGDWQLRLLGSGPEGEHLRTLATKLDITDRIVFDGQIPSSKVPAYLSRIHALVLPSRTRPNWMEQFGRVLVEAMASHVPVIGSNSGEIPNVIGPAGLVFDEGDVSALHERLARLMNDSETWQKTAQAGYERALAHYTQARVAADTVGVYKEITALQ